MRASESARALLRRLEGWRDRIYPDAGKAATIGYGHKLTRAELESGTFAGRVISREEGQGIFDFDVGMAELAVNLCAAGWELTPAQFDALMLFAFNVGGESFSGSTLRRRLDAGERATAAPELLRWVHVTVDGRLVESAGLRARRQLEQRMFLSGTVTEQDAARVAELCERDLRELDVASEHVHAPES